MCIGIKSRHILAVQRNTAFTFPHEGDKLLALLMDSEERQLLIYKCRSVFQVTALHKAKYSISRQSFASKASLCLRVGGGQGRLGTFGCALLQLAMGCGKPLRPAGSCWADCCGCLCVDALSIHLLPRLLTSELSKLQRTLHL